MVLSDTLSDLDKLNYGKYSKYQLCSLKIDMTHGQWSYTIYNDKSI